MFVVKQSIRHYPNYERKLFKEKAIAWKRWKITKLEYDKNIYKTAAAKFSSVVNIISIMPLKSLNSPARTVLAASIIMSIRNCVHLLIFLIFVSLMVVCALEIWINALCLTIFLAVYLLEMTASPLNCALESIPHSSTWTQ